MSEAKAAYWAGLFDGEGCITVVKDKRTNHGKGTHSLRVRVNMCDERVVSALNIAYPAVFWATEHPNPKHLTTYCWQLSGAKALPFLQDILPYAIAKKDVILLALEFIETLGKNRGTTPLDDNTWHLREEIRVKAQQLNKET